MTDTITGLFDRRLDASTAIERLVHDAGFKESDLSIVLTDKTRDRDFGNVEVHTKAPEGFTAGALAGGTLGALAAGLAAVGSVAVPGVGFLAAGPLVAALAGGGAGAALGGLVGGLVGLGIPEQEAKRISDEIERGGILLAIHPQNMHQADLAVTILKDLGAREIHGAGSFTPPFQTETTRAPQPPLI